MEASSADLISLGPNDFDHEGLGIIGRGTFGTATKTIFLGCKRAMKIFNEDRLSFEQEMNAPRKLGHHPNLVRLFFYSKSDLMMDRNADGPLGVLAPHEREEQRTLDYSSC